MRDRRYPEKVKQPPSLNPSPDSGKGLFSRRSGIARDPNPLALAIVRAHAAGRPPIDLTGSNPTEAELPEIARAWNALREPDASTYTPEPFGLASAREAVSAWMAQRGTRVDASRVILTASTSEAYAFLFKLLCDPGDEVLVPQPSYPLLDHLGRLEDVRARPYRLRHDGRWHVPVEEVARAVTERTRAIVLVSPNNPTGSFTKRDELAALARLGLPLLSDEVFAEYPHREDVTRASSVLAAEGALVFALYGLSKLAALPQRKLSWMAVGGPDAIIDEALGRLEIIADTFLSVATPVQLALPAILAAHAPVTAAIRARTAANLATLRGITHNSPATLLDVEGGWYATLRLPATQNDEAWALALIEHAGVLVQPGYFYDFDDGAHVVLSLLGPEAEFAEGAARLVAYVRGA